MVIVLILFILMALYKRYMEKEDWVDSFILATAVSIIVGVVLTIGVTLVNGFTGRYDKEVEFFDVREVKYHRIEVINPEDSTTSDSTIVFKDITVLNEGPSNQVKRQKIVPREDWILSVFGGFFWGVTTDVEATLSKENIEKYNNKQTN